MGKMQINGLDVSAISASHIPLRILSKLNLVMLKNQFSSVHRSHIKFESVGVVPAASHLDDL